MDIRYLAWAGYDFLGTVISTGSQGPPAMKGKSEGNKKVIAKEISPSIKGRMSVQDSPRIIHDDIRPFPGPRNI